MKSTIRTRLTLMVMGVFLLLFVFVLVAGGIALSLSLTEAVDQRLTVEQRHVIDLFTTEFQGLLTETPDRQSQLWDVFVEEMDETFQYQRQFVALSLETPAGRKVYVGGGIGEALRPFAEAWMEGRDGFRNQRLGEKIYRLLIQRKAWGVLVLAAENQTFSEVVDEFRDSVLIGIPLVVLLVFFGSGFLARRAMRPVVKAADAAHAISLTHMGQRLPEYKGKDEFGILVQTLNEMVARLEEGVRRIQQFTQDAAHELRTPLTILRGELELIYQKETGKSEARVGLQKALDKTILLGKIVEDLMLLARSDSGSLPVEKAVFGLDEVLREIVEDVRALGEGRSLAVSLSRCDRVDFVGDPRLIKQLLFNLSDNALKYTRQGRIDFSLQIRDETVEIQIRDTGIGIPPGDLPHIFDRFYRVDKARTGGQGGSGLGLSICKWIVEAHQGTIQIDSALDQGTMVRVAFPRGTTL